MDSETKKTLVLILHYNTQELTDSLYASLSPHMGDDYDLFVLDNGSDAWKKSKNPSLETGENLYFVGGLDWAFKYVRKHKEYDSLLFLNSDLVLDGKDFVKTLRKELFENHFKIVSPSMTEEFKQHDLKRYPKGVTFRQMGNWETNACREVRWIDFQSPMFHRDFIEQIGQLDLELRWWGCEVLFGFACEDRGWSIGVHDGLTIKHLGQKTFKEVGSIEQHEKNAKKRYDDYYDAKGLTERRSKYLKWSEEYICQVALKLKIYQIYYDESHKDSLLRGFVPHFNKKATVNLESGIICNLINRAECSNCDWFGVFSWKVADKIQGFNFDKVEQTVYEKSNYDMLTTSQTSAMPGILPTGPHNPRYLHIELWPVFDMLMEKLLERNIIARKPYFDKEMLFIYCNYFVAKKGIYLDYVNSLLKPAIDLFQTDGELNKLGMKAPNTQHDNPPQRFVDHTGLTQYPHIPFVLERLINVYTEINDIKVGYVL